jgi:RNA polymerase sigma-70 factor (ECF subfamily)
MDDDPRSDERLMTQVQAGDRRAYESLYARWRDRTFAFLFKRTGGRVEAEEAHQETWIRVYRWRARYDGQRPFKPWLYAIAANAGRDASRPRPELFLLEEQPGEPHGLRDLVVTALQMLEGEDRKVLLLTIEGFDAPEIATMLGTTPGAVRSRLHRVRERMRAAVGGAHGA